MLKAKNGSNLVEYIVTLASVGFVLGYALWCINPDIFKNIFSNTVNGSYSDTNAVLTIEPMTK
jgi:hypothetical protein